jgi:hypothetical protein
MSDNGPQNKPGHTQAQVLMSMLALSLGCGTEHDGYTPCPGETRTPAEKAGVPPL